jgi:bacteriophage exclusion system BrxC/D-like protein
MNNVTNIEKDTIMRALAAGLVPRIGLHLLTVGRKRETEALYRDLDLVAGGAAAFRLITGPVGSGKTFLEQMTKLLAIQNDLVVVHADLTVNHRLHGTDGKARNLYAELMTNLTTKALPEGGGLRALIESWISGVHHELTNKASDTEAVKQEILKRLRPLKDYVGGNEFAAVLVKYFEGFLDDKPEVQDEAIRWLRAEFSTKTEAREALGVRRIIGDGDFYSSLKLLAAFCRLAGYKGLLVMIDELSALTHRLPNARSRQASFEVLLTVINDAFQGNVQGLGFLVAGIPECLTDPDRGLFSYSPLRSRLQTFDQHGLVDYSGPVIKLEPLGSEELVLLLQNIRRVQALGDESKYLVPDEGLKSLLDKLNAKIGAKCLNARGVARPLVSLLNILEQNPKEHWQQAIDKIIASISKTPPDSGECGLDDFRLK